MFAFTRAIPSVFLSLKSRVFEESLVSSNLISIVSSPVSPFLAFSRGTTGYLSPHVCRAHGMFFLIAQGEEEEERKRERVPVTTYDVNFRIKKTF